MPLRYAFFHCLFVSAVWLFTEKAPPGALRVRGEHMGHVGMISTKVRIPDLKGEEREDDDPYSEDEEEEEEEQKEEDEEDDASPASDVGDDLDSWVNLPTCEPGQTRTLALEAVGDSTEFMCPPQMPVLDPPIHSGEVYTSVNATVPVKLSSYYPEVYLTGTPDMGYRITVAALAPVPKALSFRCRSAPKPAAAAAANAAPSPPFAADAPASPAPTPPRRTPPPSAPAGASNAPPATKDAQTAPSCVILITVAAARVKPVFKRTVDPLLAGAVDEKFLIEEPEGEDLPLKVCTGESLTLSGEAAHTNLLFACPTGDQYLSPKRPELAFVVRDGSCRYGYAKILTDFLPDAVRLESEGGVRAASLLLKQQEQQQQQPHDAQPSSSSAASGGGAGGEHLSSDGRLSQAAESFMKIATIYKLVIRGLPRFPAQICYQCKATPGGSRGKAEPHDCSIFINVKAAESAAPLPRSRVAWWAVALTFVSVSVWLE